MSKQEIFSRGEDISQVAPLYDLTADLERLFDIADTLPNKASYVRVEWDSEAHERIRHISTMVLKFTGARRQETNGMFTRGLYEATEQIDTDKEPSTRFVWAYNGPHEVGTKPTPDEAFVRRVFGYEVVSPENLIQIVADHTKLENPVPLLQFMNNRNIQIFPELASKLNQNIYAFFNDVVEDPVNTLGDLSFRKILFETLESVAINNPHYSRNIVSQMVSKLMQPMRSSWGTPLPENLLYKQEAIASALYEACQRGVLGRESAAYSRMMGNGYMHKYAFTTKLMHEDLRSPARGNQLHTVYGMNRQGFIYDYIWSFIDGRIKSNSFPDVDVEKINALMNTLGSKAYVVNPISFRSVFALEWLLDFPDTEIYLAGIHAPRYDFDEVAPTFSHILEYLTSKDPALKDEQVVLNKMAVENVENLMQPVLQRAKQVKAAYAAKKLVSLAKINLAMPPKEEKKPGTGKKRQNRTTKTMKRQKPKRVSMPIEKYDFLQTEAYVFPSDFR
jgi:hypothetical protein